MSKTTKIIAALGVVAGLGVAALPAFTYAAEIAGQVNVQAEVPHAIAMTIQGNVAAESSTPGVSVFAPAGSYEIGNYDTTTGTVYNSGSLQTSTTKVTILPNSIVTGGTGEGEDATFKSDITVYTNAPKYTLSVIDEDTTTSLVGAASSSHVIPAVGTVDLDGEGTGTDMNALQAGQSAWGFKGGDITNFTAIKASNGTADVIKANGTGQIAAGQTTPVYYSVSTSASQEADLYSDLIIYTATSANN